MESPHPVYEVTVAEALAQCLMQEGIECIFGNPGGYLIVQLHAFGRAGIRSVEGRHEGAAACMAAGYAQASGQVGVVYTQSGPGSTNALTGIAAAYADSTPMLLLESQIHRDDYGRDGHQEATGYVLGVDQLDIYRSISHACLRPTSPHATIRMVRQALRAAIRKRGPAVLDLSTDLFPQKVKYEDLPPAAYRSMSAPVDVQGVERLAKRLAEAERPAILVGDRLAHVGAADDLIRLCEEQEIGCATVNYARLMPEDHRLSLGALGVSGQEAAYDFLCQSDLVISIGARLSLHTTIRYSQEAFKTLVQIDSDEREIGRSMPVRDAIVGDLPATVRALAEACRGQKPKRDPGSTIAALRAKYQVYDHPDTRIDSDPIVPPRAIRVLRENLPREALIVGDTGTTAVAHSRHMPVYAKDGFYALYGLAPMGSGLPLAHGVQIARPDATVVSVLGDGAFLVYTGELSVASQHNLPVIHVVLNNGLYKSIADRQQKWFGSTYAVEVKNPDYVKLAQSFGCDGYSVSTAGALAEAVKRAVSARRPSVIEVKVDPAHKNTMPAAFSAYFDAIFPGASTGWPMPKPPKP